MKPRDYKEAIAFAGWKLAKPPNSNEVDEYDFDKAVEVIAAERGLIVVIPNSNQLQIDLDSDTAYLEFDRRLISFDFKEKYTKEEHFSTSGDPCRHVTLTFEGRTFTEWERIALQAALGSDPIREFLNAKRHYHGIPNPSRLFEKPA